MGRILLGILGLVLGLLVGAIFIDAQTGHKGRILNPDYELQAAMGPSRLTILQGTERRSVHPTR